MKAGETDFGRAEWLYLRLDQENGPVSTDTLRAMRDAGSLSDRTKVRPKEGPENSWVALSDLLARVPQKQDEVPEGQPGWYYDGGGHRKGPVSSDRLHDLVTRGDLSAQALIWKEGSERGWEKYDVHFPKKEPSGPPPLPVTSANDTLAWVLVATPVLFALVDIKMPSAIRSLGSYDTIFLLATILINSAISGVDALYVRRVSQSYNDSAFWFWLIPVYLYKRMRALGQGMTYFPAWFVAFVASIILYVKLAD